MSESRRWEALGHACLLLVAAGAAAGAWLWSSRVAARLAEAGERTQNAHVALDAIGDLRTELAEAELGVRSFAVTKQESYLKAYDAALGLVPTSLADLESVSDRPADKELLASLRPLLEKRMGTLRSYAAIAGRPDFPKISDAKIAIDRNARAAEAVNKVLVELDKRGGEEMAAAAVQRAAVARSAGWAATFQGVVAFLVAFTIFGLLLRQVQGRRVAEDTAAGSEGMMHLVFRSISEGVIVADTTGKALVFNPAAERLMGGRPPQADTGKWEEVEGLYHTDNRTPLRVDEMPLVRALSGLKTEGQEVCVRSGPGGDPRFLSVTGVPLREAGGALRGGVVVFTDVTSRRRADEEIRRLNRDLQGSVAEMTTVNRELETFTSSVSHSLRGPLRAVDGFARLLEHKAGGRDAEQNRLISVIRTNAVRMGTLMDDLLAYTNLLRRPLHMSRTEMHPLVEQAFEQARRTVPGAAAKLTVERLPAALGDSDLLRELWQNLLSNAVKFSRGADEPKVQVGTAGGNGKTIFFVRDNGVGFNMRYAHRLFGVFQRLHGSDEFEGAGMGLAIVRRIVERHGGQIWANAEEGRGATFYFSLPTAEPEEPHGTPS